MTHGEKNILCWYPVHINTYIIETVLFLTMWGTVIFSIPSYPIPFHSILYFFLFNADYDSLNGLQVCRLKPGLDAKQDACKFRRIGVLSTVIHHCSPRAWHRKRCSINICWMTYDNELIHMNKWMNCLPHPDRKVWLWSDSSVTEKTSPLPVALICNLLSKLPCLKPTAPRSSFPAFWAPYLPL